MHTPGETPTDELPIDPYRDFRPLDSRTLDGLSPEARALHEFVRTGPHTADVSTPAILSDERTVCAATAKLDDAGAWGEPPSVAPVRPTGARPVGSIDAAIPLRDPAHHRAPHPLDPGVRTTVAVDTTAADEKLDGLRVHLVDLKARRSQR